MNHLARLARTQVNRTHSCARPRQLPRLRTHRRAFTLPLVLLLLLVSGLFMTLLIQRMVNQALASRRQADAYTFHHVSLGVQEAVEAWVDSNGRRSIAESIGTNGEAFELVIEGGQRVTVRIRDAQGLALGELSGLRESQAELAAGIMVSLVETTNANQARANIRTEGPIAISVATAPREVLIAAVNSVTKGLGTKDIVDQIISLRESSIVTEEDLTSAVTASGLEPDDQNKLRQILTATPQLWEVVAEAEPLPGSVLTTKRIRYGGLAQLSGQTRARSQQERISLERRSRFIRWRELTNEPDADLSLNVDPNNTF